MRLLTVGSGVQVSEESPLWDCSSVGQSNRLVSDRSSVRIRLVPPYPLLIEVDTLGVLPTRKGGGCQTDSTVRGLTVALVSLLLSVFILET